MKKNYTQILKYLGVIFISVLLTYKLPHDSYSIIQYTLKPIRLENSVIHLSGIIPLILFLIGLKGLFKVEWLAEKNKIFIFIIVILVVVPLMRNTLDIVKTTYYSVTNDKLSSINIKDANLRVSDMTDSEITINVKLTIIDYGRDIKDFKVRMYLPEPMKTWFNSESLDFGESYRTFGNRNISSIEKKFTVKLEKSYSEEYLLNSKWSWETFTYQLYNEEDSTQLTYHGL